MITPIKLIKTEEDYEAALVQAKSLMNAEAGTLEADQLEVMATLIELYEEEHFPIDFPDPIAAIRFRMEQAGLSVQNLVPIVGSSVEVSDLLSGKLPLTLKMAKALHNQFQIPAEVLLSEPNVPTANAYSS